MLFGTEWYLVALAIIVYFAVGSVWYSPLLFSATWQNELKRYNLRAGSAVQSMIVTVLSMIILVAVEAYIIQATGTNGVLRGGYMGLKLWLGFAFATALINNVFQGGSKKLFFIDQGYHLLGLVLAGVILAA